MSNEEKKGILGIVGIALSLAGVAVSAVSSKVDDKVQQERIDASVDRSVNMYLRLNDLEGSHV